MKIKADEPYTRPLYLFDYHLHEKLQRVAHQEPCKIRLVVRSVVPYEFDISSPTNVLPVHDCLYITGTFPIYNHRSATGVEFLIAHNRCYRHFNAESRDGKFPRVRIDGSRVRAFPLAES